MRALRIVRNMLFFAFAFVSSQSVHAALLVWDIAFEVNYVADNSNDYWNKSVSVGDIVHATFSYRPSTPQISDNGYVTTYKDDNIFFDMPAFTSASWLNNLDADIDTVDQTSREIIDIDSSWFDAAGPIFYESLSVGFLHNGGQYTSLPVNWHLRPIEDIDFSYSRDLDNSNFDSEIYISGQAVSISFRQIPEPSVFVLMLLGACGLLASKRLRK
ncbi:PEP-CTERM sorting domain-containing protein [Aestuariibacter sp. AA17]|uniref:PEP-CTERM sorting domain-containing protein n=1 Tax=Fluctibacter corallii TaxID=2984329 RepID=A0ABT3A7A8_9ALTE|nr:PEP-CTERM sorting domain-containing protein [Aestuariibacter sp. AA17]MCV2884495.1 PEP-CTERM sorting domain-containing protein [Aestuariibacter sp. AA17]